MVAQALHKEPKEVNKVNKDFKMMVTSHYLRFQCIVDIFFISCQTENRLYADTDIISMLMHFSLLLTTAKGRL